MPSTRRDILLSTAALMGASAFRVHGAQEGQRSSPTDAPSLADAVSIPDYEHLARQRMSRMAFEYVAGGAGDEITLRWNQEALQRLRLGVDLILSIRQRGRRGAVAAVPA